MKMVPAGSRSIRYQSDPISYDQSDPIQRSDPIICQSDPIPIRSDTNHQIRSIQSDDANPIDPIRSDANCRSMIRCQSDPMIQSDLMPIRSDANPIRCKSDPIPIRSDANLI
ncbi:hypothetical protein WDU94_008829 [Cyamophila willieti]